MINVEAWTTIRYLHAQGKSIRAIARELGLARNTVRTALRSDSPPTFSRAPRPNPQLAPYVEQIAEMFLQKQFIGSRILRELRALGYESGESAFYAHLRTLKEQKLNARVTERFETPPGHQAQFDWAHYTISLGGQITRVAVFNLILSFSRRIFLWPSLDTTQFSVFEAIEAGLGHFGGSPKEILVDNARAMVDKANPDDFAWNTRFLELCGHYRMAPRACQPRRPQTKGKVERPFFYLEQHLIKGNTWHDFGAFSRDLMAFVADDIDLRTHATTRERPIDRFEKERSLLTPLPTSPFIGTHEQVRKASYDCLISYVGNRYSVPWSYAGKHVWVRTSQGITLIVRNQKGVEIARHLLSSSKATVIESSHYDGLRKRVAKTRPVLENLFTETFPNHGWFMEGVFIQHRTNPLNHLRGVLSLAELYPLESITQAFDLARECNTYSHSFIRGLIESGAGAQPVSQPSVAPSPSIEATADLGVYQRVLEEAQ